MKKINWNKNEIEKNNFLARIVGIIGEDITVFWLKNENCKYENCGRPTIYWRDNQKATLDFLLKKRNSEDKEYYLVEQKNFFAYYKGNLRTIEDSSKFFDNYEKWSTRKSKSTPAWRIFNEYTNYNYRIKTKEIGEIDKVAGTILVWSDVNELDKSKFLEKYNFYDVIGVTSMVEDLIAWKDLDFKEFVLKRELWLNELFQHFQ